MIRKKNKDTLAEKISGILSTTPASFDPEDAGVDETSAKLLNDSFDEQDDKEELLLSSFRKQNVDLLADVDERYAGKKGSRKSFKNESEESESEIEGNEEEEELSEENNKSAESDDDSDDNDNESDEDSEEFDQEGIDLEDLNEDKTNFTHLKDSGTSEKVTKGLCVRNQMSLWESLLEMRIQMQKCLVTSNKLPEKQAFNEIKKESGQEFTDKVSETKINLCNVLDKLLELQTLVRKRYPATKNLDKYNNKEENADDEEIPSDTEDEKEESEEEDKELPVKRRKLCDYEDTLNESHNKYKSYRNSVIQKWNEKTRIAVAKNAVSHSVLNQIEHNLSDRQRLIKRTQLKRSEYTILGHKQEETTDDNNDLKTVEQHYPEIFDDDDFYHELLRELIEVKSADITDPVQLGRQWIQLQNLRSKMKRKIDTKATKGRKIRYAVHTKLVNFMAPIDENLWTDEAKTELYNSLFGKKV